MVFERREYTGNWSDKLTKIVLKEGKWYAINVRLLKAIITGRPMVLKELNTHGKAPKWSWCPKLVLGYKYRACWTVLPFASLKSYLSEVSITPVAANSDVFSFFSVESIWWSHVSQEELREMTCSELN